MRLNTQNNSAYFLASCFFVKANGSSSFEARVRINSRRRVAQLCQHSVPNSRTAFLQRSTLGEKYCERLLRPISLRCTEAFQFTAFIEVTKYGIFKCIFRPQNTILYYHSCSRGRGLGGRRSAKIQQRQEGALLACSKQGEAK